jgi:tetratricopeptide (TPR) repeat protein
LRHEIGRKDVEAVRRLAADRAAVESQPAPTLVLLALALKICGDRSRAAQTLQQAWRRNPGDFWVNTELALIHWTGTEYKNPNEAARFHTAAAAIRPRSGAAHNGLGIALRDLGKLDDALAEFREALRQKPNDHLARHNVRVVLMDQGKPAEAMAEFRQALRLKPDFSLAHKSLGNGHLAQGKFGEAIAELREAVRLKPDFPEAHDLLATAFRKRGLLNEAIAECHTAIRLRPESADFHFNLGMCLSDHGQEDEAVAEYRTAIHLKPEFPEAHCNLGDCLKQQGNFAESLTEYKRGHELGSKNPQWRYPSAQWVKETERLLELDGKLPSLLNGQNKPADVAETLEFAHLCYMKKLHGASARLCVEAFQAEPALADDMQAQHRYNAVCAAVLAGCGQGKDDPPLDEPAKARWRKQALDWLKADLTAWSKTLESGPPQARAAVAQTLSHWKADSDLAGLREPEALAKLPTDEQGSFRALWTDVDRLLAQTGGPKP